jgi:hypothetical protein
MLDTVLAHLAPHFLAAANGDMAAARHAAGHLLAAYDTRTDAELQLAADIVSFGFHALEALSDSAAPDLTLNQKLRLRAGAVSLSREGHKARRKLDQLTRARAPVTRQADAAPAEPPIIPETPAATATPAIDSPRGPIEPTEKPVQPHRNNPAWTRSQQQRQAAEKIAENLRRNAAMVAQAATIPPPAQARPAAA